MLDQEIPKKRCSTEPHKARWTIKGRCRVGIFADIFETNSAGQPIEIEWHR